MILEADHITHLDQKTIGYTLGLAVPDEYQTEFPQARRKRPSSGWGTEIQKDEYSLNNFFRTYDLPYKETYIFPSSQEELAKYIQNLSDIDHVIICLNHKSAFASNADWGHVVLLSCRDQHYVYLIDPDRYLQKPERRIDIATLYKAIETHGRNNRAGLWIIKKS
jgi:hypothetical protein